MKRTRNGTLAVLLALYIFIGSCSSFSSVGTGDRWPVVHLRTGAINTQTAGHGLLDQSSSTRRRLLYHNCHTSHSSWGILKESHQALLSHAHGLDHEQRHQLLTHIELQGARVMGYLPENTLMVVGPPSSLTAAANHSLVVWSGVHEPSYKIAPEWNGLVERVSSFVDYVSAGTVASTGSIKNSTIEAQNLLMTLLHQLPLRVQCKAGEWPQVGIRVTFPIVHDPIPQDETHPDAVVHHMRIQRIVAEQKEYSAGIAAVQDWTPLLRSSFGDSIEVHPAGQNSAVVFALADQIQEVLEWLSERPAVRWITPLTKVYAKNRNAAAITQSAKPAPATSRGTNYDPNIHPIWAAGITGDGQVIGQGDSGLDYNHCFFTDPNVPFESQITTIGRVRTFDSTTHRKIRLYRAFADFTDANGHGTHTAGTLAGMPYGTDVGQDMGMYIGMAPDAKIAFIDLSSASDGDAILTPYDLVNDYFPYTSAVGAAVHSDSWGSVSTIYDAESQQVDAYCWKNRNFLPVFPAGNDGDKSSGGQVSGETTVNSPATSKNCIAAGATQTAGEEAVPGVYAGRVWATRAVLGPNLNLDFRVLQTAFGGSFSTLTTQSYKLVAAAPLQGCSPLTNEAAVLGGVVLFERGTCTFKEKAQYAQAAGAVAALIFDNEAAAYFVAADDESIPSTSSSIPTATMPRRLGQNLMAVLGAGRSIDVSFSAAQEPAYGFENLASFSSQGPVGKDKRVKPDLVAPGTITSAQANSPCGTVTFGGTSMATPVVAGSAVLVREYYQKGFYPSGAANPSDAFEPSSALVKATLIGGAVSLSGYEADTGLPIDPPPSFRQGFGRVFLGSSLYLQNNPYSPGKLGVIDNVPINTGDVHQYCITANGGPLSVTLVWTDYPGEPGVDITLVNDLDLVVRAEGLNGQPLLGNGGGVDNSSQPDNVNNIEQVTLAAVPAGRVAVEVRGQSIQAFSGPQPYALVINGDFSGVVSKPTAGMSTSSNDGQCAVVVATITSGTSGVTNQQTVEFELGTTSGASAGVSFECRLADAKGMLGAPGTSDWTSCSSPAVYNNLPDGSYTFSVRATGERIDSSVVFTKDTTPPSVAISSDVPGTTSAASAKITFSANDTTLVTFSCVVNLEEKSQQQGDVMAGTTVAMPVTVGQPFNCTSPQTVAWLLPGKWSFQVTATDSAGNTAAPMVSQWAVALDPAVKTVRLTSGPILKIPKRDVDFNFVVLGPDAANAQVQCALTPGINSVPAQWDTCGSSISYGQPNDGDYTFAARVVGDTSVATAGSSLPSTWAVSIFDVDSTPPTVNITAGPTGDRAISSTTVTFEFNFNEEGSTAQCKLDAFDVQADSIPLTPCASPVQLTNLNGGHYNFSITPKDAVGNVGSPLVADFIVDATLPNVTASATVSKTIGGNNTVVVTFNASDGTLGSGIKNVTCRVRPAVLASSSQNKVNPDDPRFDWQPCSSPYSFSGLVEGHWVVSLMAYDNADQAGKPTELDVWVDTVKPIARITSGPQQGANVVNPGGKAVFALTDATEKNAPGAGSPVQWQGLLKKISESDYTSYTRSPNSQQDSSSSPSTGDTTVVRTKALFRTEVDTVELGKSDLGVWANCSSSECVYNGLDGGPYVFQARGVDLVGNVGEATPPYPFQLEGSSSGLPTWALIVIIVVSVVAGIGLLVLLWWCWSGKYKRKNNSQPPNGVLYTNGNGAYPTPQNNGWSHGNYPPPTYLAGGQNQAYHPPNINNGFNPNMAPMGTSPTGTIATIPQDPVEAQQLALALAASEREQQQQPPRPTVDEEAQLKAAMEASLAEENARKQRAATLDAQEAEDPELKAAIQASLAETQRNSYYPSSSSSHPWASNSSSSTQPPPPPPTAPSYDPYATQEWPPRR